MFYYPDDSEKIFPFPVLCYKYFQLKNKSVFKEQEMTKHLDHDADTKRDLS